MTDRRDHWTGVYTAKDSAEVSWFQREPRSSLELLEECAFQPST
jgi:hypothetical protein